MSGLTHTGVIDNTSVTFKSYEVVAIITSVISAKGAIIAVYTSRPLTYVVCTTVRTILTDSVVILVIVPWTCPETCSVCGWTNGAGSGTGSGADFVYNISYGTDASKNIDGVNESSVV